MSETARETAADPAANGQPPEEFEQVRQAKRNPRVFRNDEGEPCDPLEYVREKLALPIRRVVKRGSSNALFEMELEDDDGTVVDLGNSADLFNPRKFEAALADCKLPMWRDYTRPKFRRVANALLLAAEVVESGATEADEARDWLADFLDHHEGGGLTVQLDNPVDLAETISSDHSAGRFVCFRGNDRRTYVRLDALVKHVTQQYGARTTRRDLAARLGRLGFENVRLSARRGEEIVKARYWSSPPDFDPHAEG